MDETHELVNHNLRNALISRSHEPLPKVYESKIGGNLDVKQGIPEGIIDSVTDIGLSVKKEEIDVKVEEDHIKDESLVVHKVYTSKLHKPLLKIDENKIVGNLDVKQEVVAGTIDNMADNGLNIKLEPVDIKDELLVTSAASGSASEEAFSVPSVSEYGAKHNSWKDFENMMMNAKIYHSCSICAYKTTRYSNLLIHERTHTGEKPYACSICLYKAAEKQRLVEHMRTHTGEKPYLCSICKYKTAWRKTLDVHMRTHTGEKPYCCSICKYKAADTQRLVEHMRTHTGEKPYSCSVCEFKAAKKANLVNHMKRHTGKKPHACSICEYKAAEKYNLTKHIRTHTDEKLYSCSICKYKAVGKGNLFNHMKMHS